MRSGFKKKRIAKRKEVNDCFIKKYHYFYNMQIMNFVINTDTIKVNNIEPWIIFTVVDDKTLHEQSN